MKKICTLLLACMVSLAFISCGSNEEELAQQYIDACAQNDFATANSVLDKMDIDSEHGQLYSMDKHKEYVNKKEILFLISQGDTYSNNRILFLLKENGEKGITKNDIVNLAITQGNEALPCKIIETGGGITQENFEAAISNGMDNLIEKFIVAMPYLIRDDKLLAYYKSKNDGTYEKTVAQIAKMDEEERLRKKQAFEDELLSCSDEIGSPIPAGKQNVGYSDGDYAFDQKAEKQQKAIHDYNMTCKEYLQFAIENKDLKLARSIVSRAKRNLNYEDYDNPKSNYFWKNVTYSSEDITDMKNELATAISSGAFN